MPRKKGMSRSHGKFKLALLVLSVLVLAYIGYSAVSICLYANKSRLVHADAVIVLGAAVYDDQPSPVFQERINHGIWLYQQGYADKLIFTGGKSAEDKLSEAAVAKAVALSQGVPATDISIEEQSHITEENLQGAQRLMSEQHLSSALLVSDPLHMKRAMRIGEDLGLKLYPSPTPTTRYRSWKQKFPFLCREVFFYMGYEVVHLF
ncbi:MAG: YdcF family protein [Coriobacteriia bacterium]|nr:YdcF family protein [Coriobacteriia bacterium]